MTTVIVAQQKVKMIAAVVTHSAIHLHKLHTNSTVAPANKKIDFDSV